MAIDIGRYLAGLEIEATLRRPQAADFARISQLELKTNQFNLTTRRYSEAQLRAFMTRDDAVLLSFRLRDRFGDHGLTSTLIAFREGDTLRIDSWLMSCRIFSRSAEQYILRGLLGIAAKAGATRVIGEYLPNAKNAVVADLYPRLGFTPTEGAFFGTANSPPASTIWWLYLGRLRAEPSAMIGRTSEPPGELTG